MGVKLFRTRECFKDFIVKNNHQIIDTFRLRDDNLSLYRKSRNANSKECPNLPLNLLVEVTSKCNLSCRMCNIHHDSRSGMTIGDALLERTFQLARTSISVSPFGLGEPLLHPDIAGIVGRYKAAGATVGLTTNGMLLDGDVSRGFITKGLDNLVISIDSADPFLFAEIRRGADLERICNNIRLLNEMKKSLSSARPALALNVVTQACNFYNLPQIVRLAEELNIFSLVFTPITAHRHIPEIHGETLDRGLDRWEEILETCKDDAESRGISVDMRQLYYVLRATAPEAVYGGTAPCPEPFRFMGIRANGDIFPCCNWDVSKPVARISETADISLSDLEKAWQSPEWQRLRYRVISNEYPQQCRECMANFTRPLFDDYIS
jgi:radical SAM protein with 4Fe4S-binding SPASM domain